MSEALRFTFPPRLDWNVASTTERRQPADVPLQSSTSCVIIRASGPQISRGARETDLSVFLNCNYPQFIVDSIDFRGALGTRIAYLSVRGAAGDASKITTTAPREIPSVYYSKHEATDYFSLWDVTLESTFDVDGAYIPWTRPATRALRKRNHVSNSNIDDARYRPRQRLTGDSSAPPSSTTAPVSRSHATHHATDGRSSSRTSSGSHRTTRRDRRADILFNTSAVAIPTVSTIEIAPGASSFQAPPSTAEACDASLPHLATAVNFDNPVGGKPVAAFDATPSLGHEDSKSISADVTIAISELPSIAHEPKIVDIPGTRRSDGDGSSQADGDTRMSAAVLATEAP